VGAIALAAIFIALALATIAGAILSGGNDKGSSPSSAGSTPAQSAKPAKKKEPKAKKRPKEQAPAAAAPAPAPAEQQAGSGSYDEARGAELNAQGFDLMSAGDYDGAIPILQEAVKSFPPGTRNLNYAYALFNLGKSLRLAGRPDEAIPILEQRLKIPNQTGAVQKELDLARQQADEG
jgi:tetratricopeptide (TPR) repeat protein